MALKEKNALEPRHRDYTVEVYRIALTFGICFVHCITKGGYDKPWLSNILLSCVNGFVFITGYYGVTFKPSKVLRLFATSIFCGLIVYGVGCRLGYYPLPTPSIETGKLLRAILLEPWFVTAYAVLLLMAPLMDGILKWIPKKALPGVLLPFFLLSFGWAFGGSFPLIGKFVPHSPGVGSYCGLALLATYVCARLIKALDIEAYFTRKRLVVSMLILWGITSLGFGEYASPFAVALAATTFYLFKQLSIPEWVGKIARLLSPSMFAIFLFHNTKVGFSFIRYAEKILVEHNVSIYVAFFLVATTIFFSCLIIDIPRRILLSIIQKPIKAILQKIDSSWDRAVEYLSVKLGN